MSCSAVGYPLKEVQRQDDIIRALWLEVPLWRMQIARWSLAWHGIALHCICTLSLCALSKELNGL